MAVKEAFPTKSSGWSLSSDGLSKCESMCKEKGWTVTGKNIIKVALDSDLRSIGAQSLPTDITPSVISTVTGPIILQIQKVKNVAVPLAKQHNPSLSKRLIRLQLTDGKVYVSAIEIEGAIDKLSTATPPGTKIKLQGTISVANGFLLLTKSSTEILGGQVETLLSKWSLNKVTPDNMGRSKSGSASGPPPFVAFRTSFNKGSYKQNSRDTSASKQLVKEQNKMSATQAKFEKEQDKPVRAQLEKPVERSQKKPERKPEATPLIGTSTGIPSGYLQELKRGLNDNQRTASSNDQSFDSRGKRHSRKQRGVRKEDDDDDVHYHPQSKPKSEYQLADYLEQKLDLGRKPTTQIKSVHSDISDSFKGKEQTIRSEKGSKSFKMYPSYNETQNTIIGTKTDSSHSKGGQHSSKDVGRGHSVHGELRQPVRVEGKSKYTRKESKDRGQRTRTDRGEYLIAQKQRQEKSFSGKQGERSTKVNVDSHDKKLQSAKELPTIRDDKTSYEHSEGNHWDWIGSSSSAVPFSAKRQ